MPQKRFEGDDDVALARRAASPVQADLVDPAASAPILDLSETEIHLGEVGSDERLPPERVAVINRGGGTLEWTAESSASWVEPVARLSPFSAWRRSRCAGHTRPPPRTAQSRSTSPSTSGAHPRIVSVEVRGDRAEVVILRRAEENLLLCSYRVGLPWTGPNILCGDRVTLRDTQGWGSTVSESAPRWVTSIGG